MPVSGAMFGREIGRTENGKLHMFEIEKTGAILSFSPWFGVV